MKMSDEWIRIEAKFRKGEIDETLLNMVKIKIGLKNTFLFGVLKFLEESISQEDNAKKKVIEKKIREIKRSLGII